MPFNRTKLCMAAGLLGIFLGSQAFGQGPLGFQLFAPADVSTYGGAQPPNQGYFFQYDALYWSIQSPNTQLVGVPGGESLQPVYNGPLPADAWNEKSTLDTSDLTSKFGVGSRFEFGRIEDRNGWMVSIFQLRNQGQTYNYESANIRFDDHVYGDNQYHLEGAIPVNPASWTTGGSTTQKELPTVLYNIQMYNKVSTWGVEADYIHQMMECHSGGVFEFFGGARYLEFNELFAITTGEGSSTGVVPDFLKNSRWDTNADNHIVGPQVGGRFFKKQGRWTFSTEGRFTAGLNCQNINQQYTLGPNLAPYGTTPTKSSQLYTPSNLGPQTGSHDAYARVFTPIVELRLEARYQLTRAISFHAGWTGMWMDNIARANSMVNYNIDGLGINMANNKQDVFVNGLTLGVDINR